MDEILKHEILGGLNEIKRIAIALGNGDYDEPYKGAGDIVWEADKIISEIEEE